MSNMSLTFEQVQALHQSQQFAEAKSGYLHLLKSMEKNNPEKFIILYNLAILCVEQNEFKKAQYYLKKALLIKPHDLNLLIAYAHILKRRRLYGKAIIILNKIITLHPSSATAYNNLGTVYYCEGKVDLATQAFQKVIELDPKNIESHYNLALAYVRLNEHSLAINIYQELLALAPEHAGAHFKLGCLFMEQGEFLEAIDHFARIGNDHTFAFEAKSNSGTAYLKLGNLEQAKECYLQAIKMNPRDVQLLFNLGVIHMQQGKLYEAMTYYLRLINVDTEHFDAYNNLAFGHLMLGQKETALQYFKEALRLKPNNKAIAHTIDILMGKEGVLASPPEYIQSLFDSYADHFDAHLLSLNYQVPKALYQAVKDYIALEDQLIILDLGCGTGLSGELFKKHAARLEGVDLSKNMLAHALKKNIYHALFPCDILQFLQNKINVYDLIIAGDVLVYYGDLSEIFSLVSKGIKANGYFVFDTEANLQRHFALSASGRFSHHKSYIAALAKDFHFRMLKVADMTLRTQDQQPVLGYLYVLQKIAH